MRKNIWKGFWLYSIISLLAFMIFVTYFETFIGGILLMLIIDFTKEAIQSYHRIKDDIDHYS